MKMTRSPGRGERFRLRCGPNYKKNGKKAPSEEPLYELVGLDLMRTKRPLKHVGEKIELPPMLQGVDEEELGRSPLPRLFIVNTVIPMEAPSLFGASTCKEFTQVTAGWEVGAAEEGGGETCATCVRRKTGEGGGGRHASPPRTSLHHSHTQLC